MEWILSINQNVEKKSYIKTLLEREQARKDKKNAKYMVRIRRFDTNFPESSSSDSESDWMTEEEETDNKQSATATFEGPIRTKEDGWRWMETQCTFLELALMEMMYEDASFPWMSFVKSMQKQNLLAKTRLTGEAYRVLLAAFSKSVLKGLTCVVASLLMLPVQNEDEFIFKCGVFLTLLSTASDPSMTKKAPSVQRVRALTRLMPGEKATCKYMATVLQDADEWRTVLRWLEESTHWNDIRAVVRNQLDEEHCRLLLWLCLEGVVGSPNKLSTRNAFHLSRIVRTLLSLFAGATKQGRRKRKQEENEEQELDQDQDHDLEQEEEDEEEEEEEEEGEGVVCKVACLGNHKRRKRRCSSNATPVVLMLVDGQDDDDEDDDEDEYDDDEEDEDEEEEDEDEEEDDEEEDEEGGEGLSSPMGSTQEQESAQVLEQLTQLRDAGKVSDRYVQKFLVQAQQDKQRSERRRLKRTKEVSKQNAKTYRELLDAHDEMNDVRYFKTMTLEEQGRILQSIREINASMNIQKPYRISLLERPIPTIYKAEAFKKLHLLEMTEPGSGDYYKVKTWIDAFMNIPFGTYSGLTTQLSDGVDKCHRFMEEAQQVLDRAVYGLNDAKMQILQLLGNWIANPSAVGSAIGICGPPGTGKTSLVKHGISQILQRPFAFVQLGGASDASFLEGHSYTYEGSVWGKLVQILMDSKCMNPVIYFDEVDKISDTPRGEEIVNLLIHLIDGTQNSHFHDRYFSNIDFDMSKCLFIFSYNDQHRVSPILRDRMYQIQTKGYNAKEKTIIAHQYLIPRIVQEVAFQPTDVRLSDSVLQYMIESYCKDEDGVRHLKRCLEIIHTKLNLYRLMRPNTNLFQEEMSIQVSFPFEVTRDVVDKLVKRDPALHWSKAVHASMYI